MSTTDALTITSAPNALTRYYDAKEREENAVLYINDAYLEVLNSLEKLEAENAKLRELLSSYWKRTHSPVGPSVERDYLLELRELGIEVDG
jgi:hypothetical protein